METENKAAESAAVGIFGMENKQIITDLKQHVRETVVSSFTDQSRNVEELICQRYFSAVVPRDDNTMSTEEAYRQCLDWLSAMAVIRLDDAYGTVQRKLRKKLMDANSSDGISLYSDTWENVPAQMTLITPFRCNEIWTKFKKDTKDVWVIADEHVEKQQKSRTWREIMGNLPKWAIPSRKWAIAGLCVLGVAAFSVLLMWNPIIASQLAIIVAMASGIVTVLRNGEFMYSATKKKINMSDIPSKHPMLLKSLNEDLNATFDCLTTGRKILGLATPVVA
ncbi:protein ROOT HAIR DEFECTIVE 3 homolog 1-like [Salvia hispanica]|uniref:protein ROOT HAIR DEFECTIVE 3 homolog 1-like n=1 Tax=Salvia hispanica TaxID=49212 RepID=UPI0020093B10|nr:protein ROOT HAIR DEFECTIVE 3 homolog 1-like [Salvia hispanica]